MKSAFLLIVCVMLLGCASFHDEPLSPSQTASHFEARTLRSEELRKYIESNLHHEVVPWPPETWDLEMLTMAAFYFNPEMDVARARCEVGRADVITAGEIPNPRAGFIPMYHANQMGLPPWTARIQDCRCKASLPCCPAGTQQYGMACKEPVKAGFSFPFRPPAKNTSP
jgi:cobalt-zinc-cadmium efflux system outer membrane protein